MTNHSESSKSFGVNRTRYPLAMLRRALFPVVGFSVLSAVLSPAVCHAMWKLRSYSLTIEREANRGPEWKVLRACGMERIVFFRDDPNDIWAERMLTKLPWVLQRFPDKAWAQMSCGWPFLSVRCYWILNETGNSSSLSICGGIPIRGNGVGSEYGSIWPAIAWGPVWSGMVGNFAVFMCIAASAASCNITWMCWRRRLRSMQGLCPSCGYVMPKLNSRCPECGEFSDGDHY